MLSRPRVVHKMAIGVEAGTTFRYPTFKVGQGARQLPDALPSIPR
jgi:hypothetical protein